MKCTRKDNKKTKCLVQAKAMEHFACSSNALQENEKQVIDKATGFSDFQNDIIYTHLQYKPYRLLKRCFLSSKTEHIGERNAPYCKCVLSRLKPTIYALAV